MCKHTHKHNTKDKLNTPTLKTHANTTNTLNKKKTKDPHTKVMGQQDTKDTLQSYTEHQLEACTGLWSLLNAADHPLVPDPLHCDPRDPESSRHTDTEDLHCRRNTEK